MLSLSLSLSHTPPLLYVSPLSAPAALQLPSHSSHTLLSIIASLSVACHLNIVLSLIPDPFSLGPLIFHMLFTFYFSSRSNSPTAAHLLDVSVVSENLFLLSKVSPPPQSPLTLPLLLVYIETTLCEKQWESETEAHVSLVHTSQPV